MNYMTNSGANLMQRQFSAFTPSDQQIDFDFKPDLEQSSFYEENPQRFRFDSEYVWEAGDDMYDDIVASTEPNLYYQIPFNKQHRLA